MRISDTTQKQLAFLKTYRTKPYSIQYPVIIREWRMIMAGNMITLVQLCETCRTEVGTLEFKKENMMIFSNETVWCPTCKAKRPQIREAKGRTEGIEIEQNSYPIAKTE